MSKIVNVFVSSTWLDLQPERVAVEQAIQRLRETKFVGMEYFGSRDETTRNASLDDVGRSQIYIGIFGGRYGSGITEAEYHRARGRLHCRIYFKAEATIPEDQRESDPEKSRLLAELKEELKRDHCISEFTNPDQLATTVTADLHNLIMEHYPASFAPLFSLHQLPSRPELVDREEELTDLEKKLTSAQVTGAIISARVNKRAILQGMGGVGKTALATVLAYQLNDRYPDAQIYLNLRGAGADAEGGQFDTGAKPVPPTEAMQSIIHAFHPEAPLPDTHDALASCYRSVLTDAGRVLLLLDNAAGEEQVRPLLPPPNCLLLVTSRRQFTLPGLTPYNLDCLPAARSQELLVKLAPRLGTHARAAAELCGHLPLALEVIAKAVNEKTLYPVPELLDRLRARQEELAPVMAAFQVSYELLSDELRRCWRLLAVFPASFDLCAAATVWDKVCSPNRRRPEPPEGETPNETDFAREAMQALVNASLVERKEVNGRFRLHD